MHDMKTQLLCKGGLALLASLVVPLGCSASESNGSGSGGQAPGSGGASSGSTVVGSGGTVTTTTGGTGTTTTGGTGTTATGGTGTTASGGNATTSGGTAATSGGSVGSGGTTGSGGASSGDGAGTLVNPRITLLGDSTTSDGCFRAHLAQQLTAAGHAFTFVGTRSGNPVCIGTFDQINEGHGGYIVADVLKATSTGRPGGADASDPFVSSAEDLNTWFDSNPTDVVLMNFGTNDLSNNIPAATIINAYTAILTKLRAVNPNVRMMVAQIPPIAWQFCTFAVCDPRVMALNAAAVTWAAEQNTADSPVSTVDLYTGYVNASDTTDGVHANESGSLKLANAWAGALVPLF